MIENNVISQISKKKAPTQEDPSDRINFNIGPELKYVGVQKNSHNHNLEEQLLLGADQSSLITKSISGQRTTIKEEKIFKANNDNTNEYFILKSTIITDNKSSFNTTTGQVTINLNPNIISGTENLYYHNNSTGSHTIGSDTNLGSQISRKNISVTSGIVSEIIT